MESFVNLAAAVFALTMVTIARRPADEGHPYGHHKAEYFSSSFEGLLIIGAAIVIFGVALVRFWRPEPLEQIGWGVVLSLFSSLLNGGLAWLLLRAARLRESIALEADARHLIADVWTSAAVIVGVLGVAGTGWLWLDPLLGMLVALNILKSGLRLVWRSVGGLMDEALEPEIRDRLQATLAQFSASASEHACVRFDDVATRRAGQRRFADLHMHVPGSWTLAKAASMRDEVEAALMAAVPGLRVSIQLLPLDLEPRAVCGADVKGDKGE